MELGGGESVFIFNNELFDAFACDVVCEAQGRTQMLVAWESGKKWILVKWILRDWIARGRRWILVWWEGGF